MIYHITDHHFVTHIKHIIRSKVENVNLQVNETKTKEYEIKHHGNNNWKKFKLLKGDR